MSTFYLPKHFPPNAYTLTDFRNHLEGLPVEHPGVQRVDAQGLHTLTTLFNVESLVADLLCKVYHLKKAYGVYLTRGRCITALWSIARDADALGPLLYNWLNEQATTVNVLQHDLEAVQERLLQRVADHLRETTTPKETPT